MRPTIRCPKGCLTLYSDLGRTRCPKCKTLLRPVTPPAPAKPAVIDVSAKFIGWRSRHIRQAKGMSQRELAVSIGVPRPWITKIETGITQPTAGSLMRLAAGLGVTVAELLDSRLDPKRLAAATIGEGGMVAEMAGIVAHWLPRSTVETRAGLCSLITDFARHKQLSFQDYISI
jgi:transcriptional regulator with XRE-family HTH domain